MDGEKKLVLCVVALVCVTILYAFLFVALWPYRTTVGLSLLVLICFTVVVWRGVDALGKLNEQELRHQRYRHQEETPLDPQGEAHYWPQGAQANPHRRSSERFFGRPPLEVAFAPLRPSPTELSMSARMTISCTRSTPITVPFAGLLPRGIKSFPLRLSPMESSISAQMMAISMHFTWQVGLLEIAE